MKISQTNAAKIDWTYMNEPKIVRHAIELDDGRNLCVLTDCETGTYEWALIENGKVIMHSDNGYGAPERALMHGLNECDKENYL